MVFTSTIFLFFFLPIVLLCYYLVREELKNIFLVLVSLLFYAWGEPKLILLLVVTVLMNYIFARIISSFKASRIMLLLSFIYNIGILFYFKYLIFTLKTINLLIGSNINLPSIALPLGISFFIFRSISYVMDVYMKKCEANKNIIDVALYISFFPQLTMGPITQYSDFKDSLKNRQVDFDTIACGVKRIIIGLGKKVILSNSIAIIADKAYGMPYENLTVAFAWLGVICYPLQLYFDFSGYSDVAIGISEILGFKCAENFNYPYAANSITDFWRRWHISLSRWFRDYVYIPLGGNRCSKMRNILNLSIVWVLTGIWHGAAWTFVFWGIYYLILLLLEKFVYGDFIKKLPKIIQHIYALIGIIFGWVIFRAEGMKNCLEYIKCMFGLNGNRVIDDFTKFVVGDSFFVLIIASLFSFPIVLAINKICDEYVFPNKLRMFFKPILYIGLFIVSISFMVNGTYNPFIYLSF